MSIIFSKQEAIASSIAIRAVARMQKPDIDIKLEEQLLKNAIIEYSRTVRMESVGILLRVLYEDDMKLLKANMAKVNFCNATTDGVIKNKCKVLAKIIPAIKSYLGIAYYKRLVADINKSIELDEYSDTVFFDEIFS